MGRQYSINYLQIFTNPFFFNYCVNYFVFSSFISFIREKKNIFVFILVEIKKDKLPHGTFFRSLRFVDDDTQPELDFLF